jgi:UDP-N-acetylglucosamine--N-acetylmuramyl-(pentapeptide) pyrophosphoryl-undecaprenol N-acetylglucosamine transferase
MRGPAVRPIVIAAGGTGGHFFPAEALAAELLQRGERVVLLTDARSGGLSSAVFANAETFVISGAGIAGRGWVRAIKAAAALAAGTVQARRIMARLNPTAVVAFGGYPSVAPVLAARLLKPRPAVILHEQNAVLGRANRFLARFADTVATSFAVIQGARVQLTGNPVRPGVAALHAAPYAVPTDRIELLVLGGSLGARVFSDVVPQAVALLPQALRARLQVTQQCRAEDLDRVRTAYRGLGVDAVLSNFFANVDELLRAAHLVIARAGASTIAELSVAGRPSLLVPLPNAIDDHQTANAQGLQTAGAAWIIRQADFTPDAVAQLLIQLLEDPATLARAAAAASSIARPNAASDLADLVQLYARQETTS